MSVRKAHNSGRNHLRNVVDYYERTLLQHAMRCDLATNNLGRNWPREGPVGH